MQNAVTKFLTYVGLLGNGVGERKIMRSLQYQRFLLRHGMRATAEVVDVEPQGHAFNNLIEVKLALGIYKPDGKVCMTDTLSVVEIHKIPVPGQKLQIWFTPKDTSCVLIQ